MSEKPRIGAERVTIETSARSFSSVSYGWRIAPLDIPVLICALIALRRDANPRRSPRSLLDTTCQFFVSNPASR